jgi:hypothetical protein
MINALRKLYYLSGLSRRDISDIELDIKTTPGSVVDKFHKPGGFFSDYEGITAWSILNPEMNIVVFSTPEGNVTVDDRILYDNVSEGEQFEVGIQGIGGIFLDYDRTDFSLRKIVKSEDKGNRLNYVKSDHYILYHKDFPLDEF